MKDAGAEFGLICRRLERSPARIRRVLTEHVAEVEYPIEAVIEMAIAGFLDTEAKENFNPISSS